jgi:predicted nucleotidyltransferase
VIAFPRFIPSLEGTRRHKDKAYGKVYSLTDRFRFLREESPDLIVHDPVFDETLCEVPVAAIKKHYKPIDKLKELRSSTILTGLERKAVQFAKALKESAGVSWDSIGISGSLLVGLQTLKSDIDPVVYGVENCRKAYATLESLLKTPESRFKPYSREELKALFDFRSKDTRMSFEDFAKVELRKAFQGKFMETDYFVRFVKQWNETDERYGDVCFKNSGYARIASKVADDSEALFTPCAYRIENVEVVEGPKLEPIEEIVSFRGRFCEQAKKGETIAAQGKIERVTDTRSNREHYRMILGNKPSDYMVLVRA